MGNILQGVIPKDQLFNIIKVDLNFSPFGYKSAVALFGLGFCALAYKKSKKLLDDFESLHTKITNIETNLTTEENRYKTIIQKLDKSSELENNFFKRFDSLTEKITKMETTLNMQEKMNKKIDGKLDKTTESTKNIQESIVILKDELKTIGIHLKLQKKMDQNLYKMMDGKIDEILKCVRLLKLYKKVKSKPSKVSVNKNLDPERNASLGLETDKPELEEKNDGSHNIGDSTSLPGGLIQLSDDNKNKETK